MVSYLLETLLYYLSYIIYPMFFTHEDASTPTVRANMIVVRTNVIHFNGTLLSILLVYSL